MSWMVVMGVAGAGCAGTEGVTDGAAGSKCMEESRDGNVTIGPVALQVERIMDGKMVKVLVVENMSKADALARLGRPERIRFTERGRDWEYELRRGRVILHFGGEKLCGWTEKGIGRPMPFERQKTETPAGGEPE